MKAEDGLRVQCLAVIGVAKRAGCSTGWRTVRSCSRRQACSEERFSRFAAIASVPETAKWLWQALLPTWTILGVAYSAVMTPSGRLLRRSARAADRPALFAAQFALSHACWLLTYPLAGWLGSSAGIVPTLLVLAVITLAGVHDRASDLACERCRCPSASTSGIATRASPCSGRAVTTRACLCDRRSASALALILGSRNV